MDLWLVAVAAGAGYVAKNLQTLSIDKRGSSIASLHNHQSESRNFLQQFRDKTCPLRRLAEKGVLDESFRDMDSDSKIKVSETDEFGFRSWESGVASSSGDECNLGWASSLPSAFSTERSLEFEECRNMNLSRVKRGKFVKNRNRSRDRGLNTLGTCLDAQQCSERGSIEDNPCLYPSVSSVRPVLVTDWSPASLSVEEHHKKPKGVPGDLLKGDSGEGTSDGLNNSQGHNSMPFFITGMIVGILSATTAWNSEVDKLNKLLKQMQNLVQDLQEELEMKEMLMVKELPGEGHPSTGECQKPFLVQEPIVSPSDVKLCKFDILKANVKHTESLGLLSTIEAELQAELETLENNMNNRSAVNGISSGVELNPDFGLEIVRGDLKPAIANVPSDSGTESTDATTDYSQPQNYSVSPWELSLRLHELIESRLKARIKELEMALGNTVTGGQVLASPGAIFDRKYSCSETESSSVHQSPTCICDEGDKREDGPFVDDYSSNYADRCKESNEVLPQAAKEDRPLDLVQDICKQTSTAFMSNVDSESEGEGSGESEMQLIKRIIERRRSGSNLKLELD